MAYVNADLEKAKTDVGKKMDEGIEIQSPIFNGCAPWAEQSAYSCFETWLRRFPNRHQR